MQYSLIMRRMSLLLKAAVLCLAGSGCLSEISLEVPETNSGSLAIRGALLRKEVPVVTVEITSVSNFNASAVPQPVVGASVVLIDEFNNGLDIPMLRDGIYELAIPDETYALEVKPGQSYQLSIATPEGRNYLSTLEPLHPVPAPTEVRHVNTNRDVLNSAGNLVDQEFLRFLITTPLPASSDGPYLKWDFTGTYRILESALESPFPPNVRTCYIFERLNLEKVVVFNGAASEQAQLRDFFLLEEPLDYRFSDGFYLTVRQQSLSEGAFRYWENLGKVVEVSGNFFEAPPGKITGNFRNVDDEAEEVFGYFYATEEAMLRYFVAPGEPRPAPLCPPTTPNEERVEAVCLNCLLRPGSTLVKPEFWEW